MIRIALHDMNLQIDRAKEFWQRVDKTPGHGPNGDCWLWLGFRSRNGYGKFKYRGKQLATHFVWLITHGQFPTKYILHSCDNPPCVNPEHLREGTHADNMADKVRRNRAPKGENSKAAKLTETDVQVIRFLRQRGTGQRRLARYFGITHTTIQALEKRKTWASVPELRDMELLKRYEEVVK